MEAEQVTSLHRLSEGDIVRQKPRRTFASDHAHQDGYVYARVRSDSPSPDSDGDIKMTILDEHGTRATTTYVQARGLERVGGGRLFGEEVPHSQRDRDLDDRIENASEEDSLAVLEEEQENLVQMQELRARTVEPGTLQLPVTVVTSAANSEQWAIEVDHPVVGNLRFYRKKPLAGWSDDYDIVGLLESYGIHDGNPYKLQTMDVFVEHTEGDGSESRHWKLLRREDVDAVPTPEPDTGEETADSGSNLDVVAIVGTNALALFAIALGLFASGSVVVPLVLCFLAVVLLVSGPDWEAMDEVDA